MLVFKSTYLNKVRECEDLQNELDLKTCENNCLTQIIRETADEIREMDTLIFHMSMQTTWENTRNAFSKLCHRMEKRRREESNRITDIMREELISVYTKDKSDV